MTLFERLVERLVATSSDPLAQSAVAAEFVLMARAESRRRPLRLATDAAAVLRWFDEKLLASMLDLPKDEVRRSFEELKTLVFVERYQEGRDMWNIHKSTRLGLRKYLAHERPDQFATLSARAAAYFAGDMSSVARIEWIYHLLCGDPERGIRELELLNREWSSWAHPEEHYALASALRDLDDTSLVRGKTRVAVLLATATRLSPTVAKSQAAFEKSLATTWHLAEQDPGNTDCQRDLAVAHSRLGYVLQEQGRLAKAQAAYEDDLAISWRLAEQDPSNSAWQRNLAVTYSKVGEVLEEQGNLAKARAAYEEGLVIGAHLAKKDSIDAGRQLDSAAVHTDTSEVPQAHSKLVEAQAAFEKSLAISRRLAERDPNNSRWQRDLAVIYSKVGDLLQAQGRLTEAQAAFEESLALVSRLAAQDPSNGAWQRDLALAHTKVVDVLEEEGKFAEAQAAFEKSLPIISSPAVVCSRVGEILRGWLRTSSFGRHLESLFGPTEIRSSALEDMELVASQENTVYSEHDAVPESILREWYMQNPSGFNMIAYDGKKIGHLNLLPFKQDFLTRFVEGKVVEKDAQAEDIYPAASHSLIKDLYVESFAILHPFESLRGTILLQVLFQIDDLVSRVCHPSQIRYVYAIAATEDGKRLLLHLRFSEVNSEQLRKDDLRLFYVSYTDLVQVLSKYLKTIRPHARLRKIAKNVLTSGL
jgi:tetratricopeptide (TPR) repeat protein